MSDILYKRFRLWRANGRTSSDISTAEYIQDVNVRGFRMTRAEWEEWAAIQEDSSGNHPVFNALGAYTEYGEAFNAAFGLGYLQNLCFYDSSIDRSEPVSFALSHVPGTIFYDVSDIKQESTESFFMLDYEGSLYVLFVRVRLPSAGAMSAKNNWLVGRDSGSSLHDIFVTGYIGSTSAAPAQDNITLSYPVIVDDGNVSYSACLRYGFRRTFNIQSINAEFMTFSGNYPDGIFSSPDTDVTTFLLGAPGPSPQPPDDPFSPGGTSEPGGGGGTFDDTSDTIEDSSLPTLSAANTGFTRIYNPSLAQVQALARYLWTDDNLVTTLWNKLKQFVENPMDAFIGFSLLPCAIPNGGTENFSVMFIDTGVQLTVAANQFVDVDCGALSIEEYYGSALDYSPYTKIDLFLPYIGIQPLDVDEVMGRTLQVKYRIDIVTGGCVAKVLVDGNVLYQYSGHCAMNIPFTSADYTGIVSAIIQAAKVAAAVAAGAGVGALAESAGAASLVGTAETSLAVQSTALSTQVDLLGDIAPMPAPSANPAVLANLAATTAANTVGAVENSKLSVQHSGTFSGNTGYLGVRRPYLIIKRPRMCNPAEYGTFNGYPSMMTLNLGECSGFTKVQQVQLTGLTATNPEKDQIMGLLKMGVIL